MVQYKIAFHLYHFSFRGSEVSTFDYAFYNEKILNNKSIILTPRKQSLKPNESVLNRFKDNFEMYIYEDIEGLESLCKRENIHALYVLKYGKNDGLTLSKIPTFVHCVFSTESRHGIVYAAVSESVSKNNNDNVIYPVVNHIVYLPEIDGDFRKELNIPLGSVVFGRHGGEDTFNIPFVREAIIEILSKRKDVYFLFAVKPVMMNEIYHKNIIYIDSFTDNRVKSKFINTCDVMLHSCDLGESFGLSILEFLYKNKPVITWNGGKWHKQHHKHLGEKGIYYNDKKDLLNIMETFNKDKYKGVDYKSLTDPFSPENVMKNFNSVFLSVLKESIPCDSRNFKPREDGKRIKMICNWCSSEQLCKEFSNMCEYGMRWKNIEITHSDQNIDYYVIINFPPNGEKYIPEKTIVFQMEPWVYNPKFNWGVKTWGEWSIPDPNKFLSVRGRKSGVHNNAFWQLEKTLQELRSLKNEKTGVLSSICSSKYFDEGHIKRIDFLKYLESKNVDIDIYNYDNDHKFKNWKGPVTPYVDKSKGILPYKYYFMMENNFEKDFITEKIWEPILCESLVFYYGCPNVGDYINLEAIVLLDPDDFEKSYNLIQQAIKEDWWSKKLPIIREEKNKILNKLSFFPVVNEIINGKYKKDEKKALYDKYFDDGKCENVCFIHSCTVSNDTSIISNIYNRLKSSGLYNIIDKIFIVNIGVTLGIVDPKIKVINFSEDVSLFELSTLKLVSLFSEFNKDTKLLYLHTKGISHSQNDLYHNIKDWVDYMSYCLLDNYQDCMKLLDVYDTVGCNLSETPHKHYSGNFWWANTNYLKNLSTDNLSKKEDAEWWLLTDKNAKSYNVFSSGVNHYNQRYGEDEYKYIVKELFKIAK